MCVCFGLSVVWGARFTEPAHGATLRMTLQSDLRTPVASHSTTSNDKPQPNDKSRRTNSNTQQRHTTTHKKRAPRRPCHRHDIEPLVTLHHFVHPQWFEDLGGFEKAENIAHFLAWTELAYRCVCLLRVCAMCVHVLFVGRCVRVRVSVCV